MRDYGERGPSNTAEVAEGDRGTASPLDLVVSSQRRMQKPAPAAGDLHVILVEPRALMRECLSRCLAEVASCRVTTYQTVESWIDERDQTGPSVLVLSTVGHSRDVVCQRAITLLGQVAPEIPVVVLSDAEEPDEIVTVLEKGARGYIPTTVPLPVAVEAMRLVKAGGIFVPASSLIAARRAPATDAPKPCPLNDVFTARQAAVVEALRRGKANKVIAYELNMRESTVKVHVRNIMRKLKAKNRTEVAFMTNDMLQHQLRS
jgi:DNA-binding NarL/FixJ family response regulator